MKISGNIAEGALNLMSHNNLYFRYSLQTFSHSVSATTGLGPSTQSYEKTLYVFLL